MTSPAAGIWKLKIAPIAVNAEDSNGLASVSVVNGLHLEPSEAGQEYSVGATPLLTATLTENGAPLAGRSITVYINGTDTSSLVLMDDGLNDDGAANDGVYGGRPAVSPQGGLFQLSFKATGNNTANQAFQRIGFSSYTIAPSGARLTRTYSDQGLDADNDGTFEALKFNVGINVSQVGNYLVTADLQDSKGNPIATAQASAKEMAVGNQTLSLLFEGGRILQYGQPGPYKVVNIRLYADTAERPIWIETDDGPITTAPYTLPQFDHAPVLNDVSFSATKGVAFSKQLAGTDADGDALSYRVSVGTLPTGLSLATTGLISGTPTTVGSKAVTIEVADGNGRTDTAQVTINVTAGTRPPTLGPSLRPSAPVTTDTLAVAPNAFSPDGSALSYAYKWKKNGVIIPNENAATLSLSKSGNGDKNDVIAVEVTATNAGGSTTVATQVTVVNSPPVTFSGVVNAEAGVETAFEFRGADNDGDALTFERAGGPVNGTAEIRRDSDGKLKLFYTSRARYGGTDLIKFVARDTDGRTSNVATLAINVNYVAPPPANRPPVAGDTSIDTYTGKAEVKILLGSDPDGDALTFRVIGNAKYGTSEIKRDTDGKWKLFYTSLGKYFGPDTVTYVAIDDKGRTSNVATIRVNFINRPPTAQDASFSVASGGSFSTYIFGDDPDGDDITFRQVNGARHGTSEIKRDAQGKWRVFYQSAAGYSGPDTINFVTVDPNGRTSAIATVTINVIGVSSAMAGGASAGGS